MTIKHFLSTNPGVLITSLQDQFGGQDIGVGPGYELQELMNWWREWRQVMQDPNPSVRDALESARTLHELAKEQTTTIPPVWQEAS
jgi:hypothetical protein